MAVWLAVGVLLAIGRQHVVNAPAKVYLHGLRVDGPAAPVTAG